MMPRATPIRPFSFVLNGTSGRVLFSDAFITDDPYDGRNLVLVTTYYPDMPFDFRSVGVRVDGVQLAVFDDRGRDEHAPMRVVIYPLHELEEREVHEVRVSYRGQSEVGRLSLERPPDEPVFALATLFKDDYSQIETCYRYYKDQGVERFFLFYNGRLGQVAGSLFSAPEIVYGEWPFLYWLDGVGPHRRHHAQTMFLTMVRYRFLSHCSYLALVDLDEFLGVRGGRPMTVRDYVERMDCEALSARCHWSEVRKPGIGTRIALADLQSLWMNPNSEGDQRMKTIYRGDFRGLPDVHIPKLPDRSDISEELVLHHLVNTGHRRQNLMARDAVHAPLPVS